MFTNALCYNYRVVDPLTKIIRTNAMDFIDSFARKYRPYSQVRGRVLYFFDTMPARTVIVGWQQIVGATMDQSNRKVFLLISRVHLSFT